MKKKMIVIDHEKCIQCGGCAAVCPARALKLVSGSIIKWDPKKCTFCGLCVKACPANAITMVEVEEDEIQ
jgi:ferredoxin